MKTLTNLIILALDAIWYALNRVSVPEDYSNPDTQFEPTPRLTNVRELSAQSQYEAQEGRN